MTQKLIFRALIILCIVGFLGFFVGIIWDSHLISQIGATLGLLGLLAIFGWLVFALIGVYDD